MRWLGLGIVASIALVLRCHAPAAGQPLRIATFNIEDFPKDRRPVDAAFDEIVATHASIVAVQEITDRWLFSRTARARLGASWRFVSENTSPFDLRQHYIGVAYDGDVWQLISTDVHDDTALDRRLKATFEA